jgi:hypothetical protein
MKPAPAYHRSYDPREVIDLLAGIDLQPADASDCEIGRAMAAELISPQVAPASTLQRVQARTGGSAVFIQRRGVEIIGVTTMLPLNAAGRLAVEQHRFLPKEPLDEQLCAEGEPLAAMYAWGFAAKTRNAAANVIRMTMLLRDRYAQIPFFTRAVTPAGAKVVRGRMGYSPYPGAPDDLLWNPVRTSQERAA